MAGTILITGANGNLGTTVVKHFLDNGFKIIALDGKDDHLGFAAGNKQFEFHSINLLDEQAVDVFMDSVLQSGTIDAAFLLAGGFAMGSIEDSAVTDIKKMIDLNFFTTYSISRRLFVSMQEKGYGRLVFVGARPALDPGAGKNMAAYAISKSMIFRLAEIMNAEAKDKDVTASVIVPSTIDTPANRIAMPDADFSKWVTPLQLAELLMVIVSKTGAPLKETVLKF